jgi:hypothetical protein
LYYQFTPQVKNAMLWGTDCLDWTRPLEIVDEIKVGRVIRFRIGGDYQPCRGDREGLSPEPFEFLSLP